MPSGSAVRPGDIVTSMKGNTIEVLNTDAEGRLVLCDVMWYTQETFNPCAMIDLATLTGAIIVALGSENAGIFSNDDAFCNALSAAANAETEGVWRMPLESGYDKLLKSTAADMANIGGRAAGSIIAAQFLKRFVKDDIPWIHMDIAGVTYAKKEGIYSPSGASGWGVMTLNRLVLEMMEKG
jgi:leucyl aminopeptidase